MIRIIRPATVLSPEMTSHKVTSAQFLKVQQIYENMCTRRAQMIVTDYFDNDIIKTVCYSREGQTIKDSMNITIDRKELEGNLELVTQNHVQLHLNRFQPKLTYHHERQRAELRYYGPDWTMVMQILLVGLSKPSDLNITQIIKNIPSTSLVTGQPYQLSYYLETMKDPSDCKSLIIPLIEST